MDNIFYGKTDAPERHNHSRDSVLPACPFLCGWWHRRWAWAPLPLQGWQEIHHRYCKSWWAARWEYPPVPAHSWDTAQKRYPALCKPQKEKYGAEQVLLWRRSTNVRPPELEETDPRYPGNDPKYKDLAKDELPKTENLIDTIKRVVEYWNSDIKPELEKGKNVIIAAHGNSLRGLIKYLDNMSDEDVIKLELQTGNPICYELDDNLKPIRHYYLKK